MTVKDREHDDKKLAFTDIECCKTLALPPSFCVERRDAAKRREEGRKAGRVDLEGIGGVIIKPLCDDSIDKHLLSPPLSRYLGRSS